MVVPLSNMWHNCIIFVLCSIPLLVCIVVVADDGFVCQKFDNSTQTFAYYCADYKKYRNETMANCSHSQNLVDSTGVVHFKIGGCDNLTVRDALSRLNDVRTLDVSYSGLRIMDSLNFVHDQLDKINISHNRITDYPWQGYLDFFVRFPMLREFDLSYNDLHAVHLFANRSIIKLERIHLHHNAIAFIQKRAFVNLTELQYIDLCDNKLNRINANAISNLQNLRTLRLQNNPIDFFFCDDLLLDKVIDVSISWNWIEYFSSDCAGISDAQQSKQLIVSNRKRPGLYAHVDGRYKIDCDNQNFQRIRTFKAGRKKYRVVVSILRCLGPTLIELDMSGNTIGELHASTFEHFVNLQELSLIGTELKVFDFQVLQHQRQLISLDISQNGLKQIGNMTLSWNLRDLQKFSAAGNSFESDLLWQLPSSIKYLDLSDTFVGELTPKYFQHLTELEELRLSNTGLSFPNDDNPFEAIDNLYVLDISSNDLYGMDFTRIASTLEKLREFRAADCNISNTTDLIGTFGSNLWTLDLSANFVGDLYADSPLHRLNLLKLYLNRASISVLDLNVLNESGYLAYFELAHNLLQEIDLTPLSHNLLELKMEGNRLRSVVDLTPTHFTKLRYLNIGQNQLSCGYLTEFASAFAHENAHFEEWDQFAESCLVASNITTNPLELTTEMYETTEAINNTTGTQSN